MVALAPMPISIRLVVQSTIALLAVGFLTLLAIVGMTIWLNERAQIYFDEVIEARDTRSAAVELRSARADRRIEPARLPAHRQRDLSRALRHRQGAGSRGSSTQLKSSLAPYPETEPMLQRLSTLVADKIDEMDQTVALKNDRRDEEALALLRTNRGKALMDEANVFLTGIIRSADERLTAGVDEQRANAALAALGLDHRRPGDRRWWSAASIVTVLPLYRAKSRRRATRCAALDARPRGAGDDAHRGSGRRRATAPKCCWPRSTIASPTA